MERKPHKRYEMNKFEFEAFGIPTYEVWPKHRLRFNVTKHSGVSRHEKLSPEEVRNYRETFNVNNAQIQKCWWDEAVNRYYYGQPGDIYRIYRVGQGLNYRIVVPKMLSSLKTK